MPPQHPVFDPLVLEALGRAKDLPSMPAAAVNVLRVARDPEAGAPELAAAVSLDPALSAKILQVANSPLFSGRAEITTVQRACAQLGFKTVKLMALCFALLDSLSGPELQGFDYDEYWKRSIVRAVSAKLVAESAIPALAEEAFLTGLLSRIGQLFLARCLADEYQEVIAESEGSWPSEGLERRKLGFSSGELSAALLHAWNLPPLLHEPIFHAQYPYEIRDLPPDTKDLARTLSLAATCEKLVCDTAKSKALMELRRLAKDFFAMEAETVDGLLLPLDQRTTEMAASLDIQVKDRLDMSEVFREAELELIQETLSLLHNAVFTKQRVAQQELEKLAPTAER